MKFIIVDDNDTAREGLRFFLEDILKHQVIEMATNGIEFLSIENSASADIIFMDIDMPVLDGISTVKKALSDYNYLKFIAVTGHTEKAYLKELLEAGFKGCIFKFNIYDYLEKAIKSVMSGKLYFPESIIVSND